MSNRLFIRHTIKTAYDKKRVNQESITLKEALIYFYLIDVSFFVYTFPLAKRRSKIRMEETLKDIENIGFLILYQNELFIKRQIFQKN